MPRSIPPVRFPVFYIFLLMNKPTSKLFPSFSALYKLKEMMPLEEDRPTVTLISVPDLNEHYYREIEEEFKAYALQLLEDL